MNMTSTDSYQNAARVQLVRIVHEQELLDADSAEANPEYVRGVAEFIAAQTQLSTEETLGDATEAVTYAMLNPDKPVRPHPALFTD